MVVSRIKFRIFHKNIQTMYLSPPDINHLGFWFDSHLPGSLADISNIELMQFIGIKDKNGVEIYEGDIVKFSSPDFYSTYSVTYLIAWDNDICGFTLKKLDGSDLDYQDQFDYAPLSAGSECFEVVGNKHEGQQ